MTRWVLLHGFTGGPASWKRLRAHLPDTDRVEALTLPGHGETTSPVGGWDAELERLAATLRDGPPARVVAYSFGGRLAWDLLRRAPDAIIDATLVGAHPGLGHETDRARRRGLDHERAAILRRDGLAAFVEAWEKLPLWASQASLPADLLAEQRRQRLAHTAEGLAQSLERLGLSAMPLRRDLSAIERPVHLLAGERDVRYRSLLGEVVTQLPSGRLSVLANTGHNAVLEAPAQVAALLDPSPPEPHR